MTNDPHLSPRARELMADPAEELALTTASFYECSYKYRLGRVPIDVSDELPNFMRVSRILVLDMTTEVAVKAGRLPSIHRDPWDRIIAAHGLVAGCPILTLDKSIAALGAKTIW